MKLFKRILALSLVVMIVFAFAACGAANTSDTYTIGICQLLPHPALDAATDGFIEGLKAINYTGEFDFEVGPGCRAVPFELLPSTLAYINSVGKFFAKKIKE